ncbi:CIS tube protein [Algoriphagus boritolerans]|uniref:LysM domain-containing protein n=1 Tax=Algoriphagus boritolerans DSM 17298 = JCM 18970 TaxID=1120964 RepID=A0A1H5YMK6_9BACT|nr:LysM peptidoglycan-binding domain-containing protein [Algoriphagus boritolerans]SEG25371.1 hypothetical protein SAMN03080598_03096 [Algoriphagus boritolerans DSM 17298 = JCM 18970]
MALKDIFSPLGGLEKLKITAFSDDQYNTSTETYVVMYNPTAFSQEITNKWIPEEGLTDGAQNQFKSNQSEGVSFEFFFDATAASPPGKDVPGDVNLSYLGDNKPNLDRISGNKISAFDLIKEDKHVDRAIQKFLEITQKIQSPSHKPNFLQINWGAFQFRGVLEKATINYKLFNGAGLPIRATIAASFKQSISRQEQAAEAGRTSPDLTHIRVVKAGDTLPIMCLRIYGTSEYYLEVARANKLTNFRNLSIGQEVFFPPLAKS